MTRKLASFIAICTLSLGLIIAYCTSSDAKTQALRAFQKGKVEIAATWLAKSKQISKAQKLLCESYLCRAGNNFEQSNFALGQALAELKGEKKKNRPVLKEEIQANQLLNFYLQGQTAKAKDALKQIDASEKNGIEKNGSWIALFEAVAAQQEQDHLRALALFDKAQPLKFCSPWMQIDFNRTFSSNWQLLFQARSYLALGETVRTRQILQTLEKGGNTKYSGEKRVLIALSYMQEGRSENDELSCAYFKLASAYLDTKDLGESEGASDQVSEICLNSIQKGQIEVCGALIESLEQWGADHQINQLADALIEPWLAQNRWPDSAALREIIALPPAFRKSLDDRLVDQVAGVVGSDHLGKVALFYKNALLVISDKATFEAAFELNLKDDLLQRIKKFYSGTGDDLEVKMALIDERLQSYTTLSGLNGQKSKVAIEICDLTPRGSEGAAANTTHFIRPFFQVSSDQKAFVASALQNHLQRAFAASWEIRDFGAMSLQCEIAQDLELKNISNVTPRQVSTILGDAEFQLKKGELDQALERLEWVLEIDPGNREAIKHIVDALCARKDFAKALTFIVSLDAKGLELAEKQVFCSLQLGQIDQALVAAKSVEDNLSDDLLESLGKEAYCAGYFERAEQCLFRIAKPNQVTWRLRVCATFRNRHYRECWNSFCYVSEEPFDSPKLAATALCSLIELRKDKEGKQLAQRVAQWLTSSDLQRTEPAWEEALVDEIEPAAIAARFYRERLEHFDQALKCLDLAKGQSPQILFERVRILLEKKQPKSALDWINDWTGPLTESQQLQKRALECRSLLKRGDEASALIISNELSDQSYLPLGAKIDQILALEQLGLWQNALDLLDEIKVDGGWEMPIELHRVQILGELGRYSESFNAMTQLQKSYFAGWGTYERDLISLMGLKALTGTAQMPRLLTLPKKGALTPKRCARLALYFLDTGDVSSARQLRDHEANFGLSDLGNSALAKMAYLDQKNGDALCQVKRALRDPQLSDDLFARHIELFARLADQGDDFDELLALLLQQKSQTPTDKALLRLSRALTAHLTWQRKLSDGGDRLDPAQLKIAQVSLKELRSLCQSAPKLLWPPVLLGQLLQITGDELSAQSAYDQALSLNENEGAANFGKSQDARLDLGQRAHFAEKACCCAPQRPDYWLGLASLQIEQWRAEKSTERQKSALSSLMRANAIDPLFLEVYWCTAKFHLLLGQGESAQKLARGGFEKVPDAQREQLVKRLTPDIRQLLNRPLTSAP